MLLPVSDEFVQLCDAQVSLLINGMGASLCVVYLTKGLSSEDNTQLFPVVTDPAGLAEWTPEWVMTLLRRGHNQSATSAPQLQPTAFLTSTRAKSTISKSGPGESDENTQNLDWETALSSYPQVVMPLVYEGVILGVLATVRADRPWTEAEHKQLDEIARTLAIARVMDQQSQWSRAELHQLQQRDQQQRDILDNLLHQFRNPLTALRTFSKLLLRRLVADDDNRPLVKNVMRESDRLQELLTQFDRAIDLNTPEVKALPAAEDEPQPQWLLSAAQDVPVPEEDPTTLLPSANFITGEVLQLAPHHLNEILHPLLDTAQAIAQERQLSLQTNLPDDSPPVDTDDRALREVLNNLLDNALKYTPSGGIVTVLAGFSCPSPQGDLQGVAIADTGPGIPLADQDHLFERHYRGVQANTDIPGTGLGLAIARELVQQMRGDIEIFSPVNESDLAQQLGHPFSTGNPPGTLVVVWLPTVAPDAVA